MQGNAGQCRAPSVAVRDRCRGRRAPRATCAERSVSPTPSACAPPGPAERLAGLEIRSFAELRGESITRIALRGAAVLRAGTGRGEGSDQRGQDSYPPAKRGPPARRKVYNNGRGDPKTTEETSPKSETRGKAYLYSSLGAYDDQVRLRGPRNHPGFRQFALSAPCFICLHPRG